VLGRSLSFSGVAVWDTLKTEIERVLGECPGALQCYPDPRSDRGREPPLSIGLAPWATEVARDLHARFGDDIVLDVGALRFPDRQVRVPVPELAPELDPGEGEVTVDPALEVRSGHTVRSELKVWNRADAELEVVTTGMVFGWVVDPSTGSVVGGYSGAQRLPRVVFRIAPHTFELIPLLVGTASFVPDLDYAIPPGRWVVRVPLALGDGRRRSTPPLPITVIP